MEEPWVLGVKNKGPDLSQGKWQIGRICSQVLLLEQNVLFLLLSLRDLQFMDGTWSGRELHHSSGLTHFRSFHQKLHIDFMITFSFFSHNSVTLSHLHSIVPDEL